MSVNEVEVAVPENLQNGEMDSVEETNGSMGPDEEMNENDMGSKEVRVVKKAKRFNRQNSGGSGKNVVMDNGSTVKAQEPLVNLKNSRKSRTRTRGLPKKGGAGGKGTWGAPGDELMEDGHCRDAHDPNYDSESEDEYVVEKIEPLPTIAELSKLVEPILLEYFEHSSTEEVIQSVSELNVKNSMKPKIIEIAISLALDRKATHREMTSILISDLYGKLLSMDDITKGFDDVLQSMGELTIDTPDAPVVVGQFIARAVADDCLAPKFITSYKGSVESEHKQAALDKAEVLLSRKHGIVRLDNIWGTGGGIRPVKYLIKQMVLLLKEYLSSGDVAEATRCLQELEVPHFHHELVYEGTVMVLEDTTERSAQMMGKLLKSLGDAVVITPEQMSQGFRRVFDELPDLCLDVPNAYTLLERFAAIVHKEGVLSEDLYRELPQRGRKRFVSEGDGGKIKQ